MGHKPGWRLEHCFSWCQGRCTQSLGSSLQLLPDWLPCHHPCDLLVTAHWIPDFGTSKGNPDLWFVHYHSLLIGSDSLWSLIGGCCPYCSQIGLCQTQTLLCWEEVAPEFYSCLWLKELFQTQTQLEWGLFQTQALLSLKAVPERTCDLQLIWLFQQTQSLLSLKVVPEIGLQLTGLFQQSLV